VDADDGPALAAAGAQSSATAKLRAAIHAPTAFRATADVPLPPPESAGPPQSQKVRNIGPYRCRSPTRASAGPAS